MNKSRTYILVTAIILGFFMAIQSRSFEDVNEEFQREVQSNVFQEIKILKEKNENLRHEARDLEANIELFLDQNLALDAIESEIAKYVKLSGKVSVFGPGVSVIITGEIPTPWVVDMVNALFSAGAEAVSVNGIRLTNMTTGFDTLPQGQILLNGSILASPYEFRAIGESSGMLKILELPGGIFSRIHSALTGVRIESTTKDIIQMN